MNGVRKPDGATRLGRYAHVVAVDPLRLRIADVEHASRHVEIDGDQLPGDIRHVRERVRPGQHDLPAGVEIGADRGRAPDVPRDVVERQPVALRERDEARQGIGAPRVGQQVATVLAHVEDDVAQRFARSAWHAGSVVGLTFHRGHGTRAR
jgi:hypothetical protein